MSEIEVPVASAPSQNCRETLLWSSSFASGSLLTIIGILWLVNALPRILPLSCSSWVCLFPTFRFIMIPVMLD